MASNEVTYKIKHSWILLVLLIAPLGLGLGLWDYHFNEGALLPYFALTTLYFPLYLLFFEMPHIMASFLGFADKEYERHYHVHLWFGVPFMLLVFGALLWVNFELAVVVYLVATMYHVMRQQTGIAFLFNVPRNTWHTVWSWGLIISTAFIYVALITPEVFKLVPFLPVGQIILIAFVISIVAGLVLTAKTSSRSGVWYVIMTLVMIAASYYLIWLGYFFLGVFVARFVHDVTAFLFYITHEMNRNVSKAHNYLYRFLPYLPVSLIVIVPLVAIFLGLVMREGISDTKVLFTMIMLLGFIHYYLESVMWKRGAPHRQHVLVN